VLWDTHFTESLVSLAGLTEDEAILWAGVDEEARSASQITIRQVNYRTDATEKYLQTCNSGISATFQLGDANVKSFGIIQAILEVVYAGKQHALLEVNWFSRSTENGSLRGTS
jgi:hypothetical protein